MLLSRLILGRHSQLFPWQVIGLKQMKENVLMKILFSLFIYLFIPQFNTLKISINGMRAKNLSHNEN